MEIKKSLPVIAEPDVVVCGCGSAGITATIAAARMGAKTLAVERWGFAGGYMTAVFGPGTDGFADLRTGRAVIGGIVFEFIRSACGVTEDIASTHFQIGTDLRNLVENPDWRPIRFDVELFKLKADRLMEEARVKVLYHTHVADALVKDGRIEGIVVVNKGGLGVIKPKIVIDTTGDADVAAFAGASYEINDELQPMSLHFRVRNVKGIDAKLKGKCAAVLEKVHADGILQAYGGPWIGKIGADEVWFNATRIFGNGTDPLDVTRAEIQGRKDARIIYDALKENLEELKESIFVASGPVVGVRETRRIVGESVLTREDIFGRKGAADVVCLGAWYLDRHPAKGSGFHIHEVIRPYEIGFSTLLPKKIENLIVAGRCHSAESAALASSRVNVTAMGMGQAAGTAAAICVAQGIDPRSIDVKALQNRLMDDGAIILERAEEVLAEGDALGEHIPESKPR